MHHYPHLYHMAAAGSWPNIRRHGLLPTQQIITTSHLPTADQTALLRQPRPHSTTITHPVIGTVTIRDQLPLRLKFLIPRLIDMTVTEWLETLNNRVFFWLHHNRLERLLNARQHRHHEHDVITLDTRSLVQAHQRNIRLSPINSGATLYPNTPTRGPQTFVPIADYPFTERRKRRDPADAISELAVTGGVPDLANHVVAVHRRQASQTIATLHP